MNDQHRILNENQITFQSIYKRLTNHFWFGDDTSERRNILSNSPFNRISFPFDTHPGPMSDALIDSANLSKTLFLYIYSRDNFDTYKVNEIFHVPSVIQLMQQNFIFFPLEATSTEGWRIITDFFKFRELPLFALIRPHGSTLEQSQIFMKHEGLIGETALLSYISIENQNDGNIVAQQDLEFQRVVEEAEENQRSTEEIEQQALQMEEARMKKIEDDFNAIPVPLPGATIIIIKFLFPDNVGRTREFPSNGTVDMLFAFVRKFETNHSFVLMTGFPMKAIEESNYPISSICNDRHFIIHVDENEL